MSSKRGTIEFSPEGKQGRARGTVESVINQQCPKKVVCAIYASKTLSQVVGIAFAMIDTGTVVVTEINDSVTLTRTINKLDIHKPTEIILEMGCSKRLIAILESNVNCKISLIAKRYFANSDPSHLQNYCVDVSRCPFELSQRQFGSSAASAVMCYSMEIYPRFKKFRINYEPCESTVFIDKKTAQSLELVENLQEKGNGLSLFKVLNQTKTKMGERILKNNILQPLSDLESLSLRAEAIQELLQNDFLLQDIRTWMGKYQDLDKLFNLLLNAGSGDVSHVTEQNVNSVLLVRQTTDITTKIGNLLQDVESPLLMDIKAICDHTEVAKIQSLIDTHLNEDCLWATGPLELKKQRCYAIRCGKNGLLDVSRQVYHNLLNEVTEMIDVLADQTSLELIQYFDNQKGFIIRLKNYVQGDRLPDFFINRVTKKGSILEFTTLDLMKLNIRIENVMKEIILMSDEIIEELQEDIKGTISTFFMLSEAIAILDLLCNFAHIAFNKSSYTSAELNHGNKMVLKASRHPILDSVDFIPNDIIVIKESSRVQIITGTNMSGKSLYLRQIALSVILAQIGCFLPADYAMLPIFRSLHARILTDNFEINASTFSAEMTEMATILKEIDENSLVIVDELGRGSSLNDGFAISLAITESLANYGCMAFVTTHFGEIPKILSQRVGFVHLRLHTTLGVNNELIQHHKINSFNNNSNAEDTSMITEGYGILMAEKFWDHTVIEDAKKIRELLIAHKTGNSIDSSKEVHLYARRRLMINLIQNLKLLEEKEKINVTNLKYLQDQFIENFKKL